MMSRIEKKITISANESLHARPASLFVQKAVKYNSSIWIKKGKEVVNGKSIIELLSLGIEKGTEITLIAEGDDAEEALQELEGLLMFYEKKN